MSKTRKALIIAALAALSVPAQAQTAGPLAPAEGIVIRTTGEVRVKPDLATVQAGVVSEGKTAAEALSKNTPALARLIEAVKSAGVAQGDLSTSQVALTPRMTQPSASSSPQPRAARIDGYEARTGITVIVRDIAKAGPLIDALVTAGANDMSGISFGLADEDKARDQARDKAAEAARGRAEIYAKRLGVKVGELVSIVEAEAEPPVRPMADARAYRIAAGAAPIQIEPGDVTISAALRTVWRIEK